MKIGILTFPCSISYGAVLQMYALYSAVNKLGHDAEVINYHSEYMRTYKHINHGKKLSFKSKLKHESKKIFHRKLYKNFFDFERNNMLRYPLKEITSKSALHDNGLRYDAVICGSDQVWNPDITDSDMSYFLDFCTEKTRRISYAPSFGVEVFSKEFSSSVKRELDKFYRISVREAQGQDYLIDLLGKSVQVVADPTFLIPTDEWRKIEVKPKVFVEEYILYYTIKSSHTLMKRCLELSQKTGLKVIIVGGNNILKFKNENKMVGYAVDISPCEWLYLLDHAKYVVTNSFHGTAFSINFRKNFFVEFSSYTNSRLDHITSVLGLQERVIKDGKELTTDAIDYSSIEAELTKIIDSSMEYLKEALL